MTASWWERIDRAEVIAAVDDLLNRRSGMLVVRGTDGEGRDQAATLAVDHAEESGAICFRGSGLVEVNGSAFQGSVVDVRRQIDQRSQPAGTLSGALVETAASIAHHVDAVVEALEAQEDSLVVLDTVDRYGELTVPDSLQLTILATRCRVVVTSDREQGASWSGMPAVVRVLGLGPFSGGDIEECVQTAFDAGNVPAGAADAYLAEALGILGVDLAGDDILPMDAYVALQVAAAVRQ